MTTQITVLACRLVVEAGTQNDGGKEANRIHAALDLIACSTLDGWNVLLARDEGQYGTHWPDFQHDPPCHCLPPKNGTVCHDGVNVVVVGGVEARQALMFRKFAFELEHCKDARPIHAELWVMGGVVCTDSEEAERSLQSVSLGSCSGLGQLTLGLGD